MAISFSRPDPSSPASVAEAAFGTARRGFDQQEVRDFLRMVAAELARLQERERFLERELRTAQVQVVPTDGLTIDDELATRLLGEEAARILQTAREGGTAIRGRAEEGAAQLLREAGDEARRVRETAELEAARRRSDAAADAESELSMAKQQGREMVEEARAYRERVLSELSRRRDLARQQIEQLVHGRDRLLQAFERARLVAVDVVGELSPLGEPDEYVDLAPTTGPVPIMIPAASLGDVSSVDDIVVRTPQLPPPAADVLVDEAIDQPVASDVTIYDLADEVDEPAPVQETAPVDKVALVDEVAPVDEEAAEIELAAEAAAVAAVDAASDAASDVVESPVEESPVEESINHNVVAFPTPEAPVLDDADETTDEADAEPTGDAAEPVETVDTVGDEIDDDDVTATDVDALFARLRANPPIEELDDDAETTAIAEDAAETTEDSPFATRNAALVPLIVAAARRLKRVLADEQNDVLDVLRRGEPVADLDALLPPEPDQATRYIDAITTELVAASAAGATSVGGHTDIDLGPDGPLAPVRVSITDELIVPLRERLTRAVEEGELDNDVITKRIRGVYREWKTQRIDEQLDDVFRLAHGHGALASLDVGASVIWAVDPDGPPSPDCEDNALGGAVSLGDAFPSGHVAPPMHPGCRCLLLPAPR